MIKRTDAIKELQSLQDSDDCEMAHSRADTILCELLTQLGYEDVVMEWDRVGKWYA